MDVLTFANKYLQPYKVKGEEINAENCPFCSGQSKDRYKFYLNVDKQTFKCHRASCSKKGHFSELCKHFGETMDTVEREAWVPPKTYKKPEITSTALSPAAEEYLRTRKISSETIKTFNLTEKNGNIVFPFYDENSELVFIKYRPARKINPGEKKATREPGGKPILFGMDLCSFDKPLIITEGELDALAVYESGVDNVVSVPSGASDFTWIDHCWDWLSEFKKIILFGDSDVPGKEMVKKLCIKLGEDRCYTVEQKKHKDANELLYKEGKEAVKAAIEEAKPIPFEGIIDLADVFPEDETNIPRIRTNIKWLDKMMGGFLFGELSVWTGRRGEGKSTFLGQMLIEAINEGYNVCVYTGELTAVRFQSWIHKQMAGPGHIRQHEDWLTKKTIYSLPKEIHDRLRAWYKGRLFLYDNTVNAEKTEENSIIRVFSYAARRYDCKMFMVDNLMTAKIDEINDNDYYRRQSIFVGKLVEFAKVHNVHVHLVAHPNKARGSLDNESVSGSGDIVNKADNSFAIERQYDNANMNALLKIMKCRSEGGVMNEKIGLMFEEKSKRFWNPGDPGSKDRKYSWEAEECQE